MISVIIPTYNRTNFLESAVRSILAQTFPASEIIIIDDGSDPEYVSELQRISKLSSNIALHHLPANKGLSNARNYGVAVSKGDYLLFLDDDDALHPKMFEAALSAFKQNDEIDVVTFGCKILSECRVERGIHQICFLFTCKAFDASLVKRWLDRLHKAEQIRELERKPFSAILKSCPAVNSCLIRKEAIGDCFFQNDLVFGEDWYFWLSLANKNCRFKAVLNYYAYVRRHDENSTKSEEIYYRNIPTFLNKIAESGMLKTREDRFNIQARFLFVSLKQLKPVNLKLLISIIKAPDLALKFLLFYLLEHL